MRKEIDKKLLTEQIIKRLSPKYVLTLNTCSSMSMSSLNRHLSCLSAIVNRTYIKSKKWYLKRSKRIWFWSFNEISKGGHSHSNIFVECPPLYSIDDVIDTIKSKWILMGRHKHYVMTPNKSNGDFDNRKYKRLNFECNVGQHSWGDYKKYIGYQIKDYEDDIMNGLVNQYSKFSNNKFNIW